MKINFNKFKTLLFLTVITLNACNVDCTEGSGKQITESRTISDFDKIELNGAIKLEIIQDSTLGMQITADDNILSQLKTTVNGGVLEIGLEGNYCNTGEISIVVHSRNLKAIDVSGASEIISNTLISSDEFKLVLSGSSEISLNLSAGNLITKSSGSSTINLVGQARKHDVDMSGSTELNAFDFTVSEYILESSGASNCKINVLTSLITNTSGTSEIVYKGSPKDIKSDKTGVATIEKFQ
jgi:hypothetical protein